MQFVSMVCNTEFIYYLAQSGLVTDLGSEIFSVRTLMHTLLRIKYALLNFSNKQKLEKFRCGLVSNSSSNSIELQWKMHPIETMNVFSLDSKVLSVVLQSPIMIFG